MCVYGSSALTVDMNFVPCVSGIKTHTTVLSAVYFEML